MSNREPHRADVLPGTLDLMVLQTVSTIGPLHGYAIAARLDQVSHGALQLNMGTLYPALMRLEQRGLLRAAWGVTENQRRARFYSISAAGRRQLADERAQWDRMTTIMQGLLRAGECADGGMDRAASLSRGPIDRDVAPAPGGQRPRGRTARARGV